MRPQHRFTQESEVDKSLKPGDIVMTKRPASVPWLTQKKATHLLLKIKAIDRSLKSSPECPEWQVVWFEGMHQPLYYSSLVLVRRGNNELLDVAEFKPIHCT